MSDDIKNNVKEDSKIKENTVIENTEEKINYNIEEKEADKKANKLCIISLLIIIIPNILAYIFEIRSDLMIFLAAFGPLIAYVIMIYARVKYPNNTFGKILMALYILGIIVLIIAFCVSIISCINNPPSCPG